MKLGEGQNPTDRLLLEAFGDGIRYVERNFDYILKIKLGVSYE